jgi:surface antigen
MLVGGGIGWYLRVSTTPTLQEHLTGRMLALTDDGLFAQDALRHLLEAVPSGVAVGAPLRDGQTGQLKASFTFRATNGFPCRRYEINDAAERRFAGFACRSMDGQWLVHSHVSLAEKAQKGKGFLPAAAEHDAALDAAIRASMSGDVLETGQEAQLIANRWKSDRR